MTRVIVALFDFEDSHIHILSLVIFIPIDTVPKPFSGRGVVVLSLDMEMLPSHNLDWLPYVINGEVVSDDLELLHLLLREFHKVFRDSRAIDNDLVISIISNLIRVSQSDLVYVVVRVEV